MVQFASDGHAMRQPCHLHRKMCEPVSDVVSGGLPVDSCGEGENHFPHLGRFGARHQPVDAKIAGADSIQG